MSAEIESTEARTQKLEGLGARRKRAIIRLSTGAGVAWRSSKPAQRMAVR